MPGVQVDAGIAAIISWCAHNGIQTLASCQGGREPAYILFETTAGMTRFFDLVNQLPVADSGIGARAARAYDVPPSSHWSYEVGPTYQTRLGTAACLWGVVRFPPEDALLLGGLLDP